VNEPLVYHLFGRFSDRDSLVLTEDDYFDYLVGVTKNRNIMPPAVLRALSDSTLLFIGFPLTDWNFRMLFRSLSAPHPTRLRQYIHLAVQDPANDETALSPEQLRRYQEQYFAKDNFSIYRGSPRDFTQELRVEWNKKYGDKMPI